MVWHPPVPAPKAPFQKIFVTVTCERCDRRSLERVIRGGIAAVVRGRIVTGEADADTIIEYSEGDSVMVLDAPEEFEFIPYGIRVHPRAGENERLPNAWWWKAEIYRAPRGPSNETAALMGSVNKLRGRPARYFLRQLRQFVRQADLAPGQERLSRGRADLATRQRDLVDGRGCLDVRLADLTVRQSDLALARSGLVLRQNDLPAGQTGLAAGQTDLSPG